MHTRAPQHRCGCREAEPYTLDALYGAVEVCRLCGGRTGPGTAHLPRRPPRRRPPPPMARAMRCSECPRPIPTARALMNPRIKTCSPECTHARKLRFAAARNRRSRARRKGAA